MFSPSLVRVILLGSMAALISMRNAQFIMHNWASRVGKMSMEVGKLSSLL